MPYYHQGRRGSALHLQQRDSRLAVTAQHCGCSIFILQSLYACGPQFLLGFPETSMCIVRCMRCGDFWMHVNYSDEIVL